MSEEIPRSPRHLHVKESEETHDVELVNTINLSSHGSLKPVGKAKSGEPKILNKRSHRTKSDSINPALKWNRPSSNQPLMKKVELRDAITVSSEDEDDTSKKKCPWFNDDSAIVISSEDDSFTEVIPPSVDKQQREVKILKRKLDLSLNESCGNNACGSSKRPRNKSSMIGHQRLTASEVRSLFEPDKLSQQMRRFLLENEQHSSFLEKKIELAQGLESTLSRSMIRNCQVHIVGSSVNGFGRKTSDCDLCLVVDENETTIKNKRVNGILHQVKQLLHRARFVRKLKFIPAKVRILKFEDNNTGMEVDLNVNNITGLRNTQLMFAYSQCDPRVRPLVLCVKEWAHQNDINDASRGTLSSYALCLMVIHYLQCGVSPSVLPSLQILHPHHFHPSLPIRIVRQRATEVPIHHSQNHQTLSDLLVGFFCYFSNFDFDLVMSVRQGQCFSDESGAWEGRKIRIEEPFDKTNAARAFRSDNFPIIVGLFRWKIS